MYYLKIIKLSYSVKNYFLENNFLIRLIYYWINFNNKKRMIISSYSTKLIRIFYKNVLCINSDNKIKLISIIFYSIANIYFYINSGNKIKLVYYIILSCRINFIIILISVIR